VPKRRPVGALGLGRVDVSSCGRDWVSPTWVDSDLREAMALGDCPTIGRKCARPFDTNVALHVPIPRERGTLPYSTHTIITRSVIFSLTHGQQILLMQLFFEVYLEHFIIVFLFVCARYFGIFQSI
jgi:hypothetical protein